MKMVNRTIGIVETEGLLEAFLAGDAMIKGSNVEITGRYLLGGGIVTLVVSGAPGAVKSAISIAEKGSETKGIRTAIIPNLSSRVANIMFSSGEAPERTPLSTGKITRKFEKMNKPLDRIEPVPKEAVPSIFDSRLGSEDHLEQSYMNRQKKERSQTEVKKRQALIIQYLVANRHRKIAISDMERVIPNTSKVTLRRDIGELIEQGKILKNGKGRATHYSIA